MKPCRLAGFIVLQADDSKLDYLLIKNTVQLPVKRSHPASG